MKKTTIAIIAGLALGVSALYVTAQPDAQAPAANGDDGAPPPPPRPPRPPIEVALDANGDGIISADEIANASAALKTLDKNGDGQLTPDEYRPKFRPGRGPGGPEGSNFGPGPGGHGHRPPPPQDGNSQPAQ